MNQIKVYYLFIFLIIGIVHGHFPKDIYKTVAQREITDGDPGTPLFLTPYIENNQIQEGQDASRVVLDDFNSTVSYSGYFTTDAAYNSSLFFWYFPAESNFENAPLLVWLQGGPGSSSLLGLFAENGPFIATQSGQIEKREYSWTRDHSVVYIDNPVGTGFSITNGGYAENQTKVGEDLHNAFTQFLTLFPELQDKPFFITGESYAGKYIPAFAHTIHNKNPEAALKINLQGVLIGDGLSDPVNQVGYGEYTYQLGLVDINTRDQISAQEAAYQSLIEQGEYSLATAGWNEALTILQRHSNIGSLYNYLLQDYEINESEEYYGDFVQKTEVRKALHVGNTPYGDYNVEENLYADITKSVAPWVSEILSHYRVLIYTGQIDIIVAYPLTLNYLQKLNFSSADEYKVAPRKLWYVGEDLAGYVKQAGNLTEVLVRNAGHLLPGDQPEWAYDMVYRFIRNQPFDEDPSS